MQKTPMRQPHRLSVFLMFVVVMSYPLVVQAMPESFVVEYAVRFGKYDKRAYTYVEGLLHGTIDRPDGSSDRYSTPVVLIYPDKKKDGNGFGWVDIPTTSYFLLYPNAFCKEASPPCPTSETGRRPEDQISQGSRLFSEDFLFRQGYVYMSIQYNKYITDNFGPEPPDSAGKQRSLAYGTIAHGSDAYTILQDASLFLRNPGSMFNAGKGKKVKPPHAVDHVLASGWSHAAWFARAFLTEGYNRSANGAPFFDGMLHIASGRFCRQALDVSPYIPSASTGLTCVGAPTFQDQLDGKLIVIQTETDFSNFSADQARDADPQHPSYRVYEVAGVSHIPQPVQDVAWLGAFRQNPTDARPFVRAAIDHLHDWISEGRNPPASVYVDGQRTTSGWVFNTDADGNTTGGIRPPSMPSMTPAGEPAGAPTGVYRGTDATFFPSGNLAPAFGGTYTPFSDEELARRYPTEDVYLELVTRAADQLLQDEYILEEDRDLYIVEVGGDPVKKGHP